MRPREERLRAREDDMERSVSGRPAILMALATSVVVGCGSGDGSSSAVSLQLALTASDPPAQVARGALSGADAQGSVLTITSAVARVRDIELDLPDGSHCSDFAGFDFRAPVRCGDGGGSNDAIKVTGPFTVDLVAGTAEPSLEDLTIPAGVYRRVDVRFEPAEDDDDALQGYTLVAEGDFASDQESAALDLRLRFNEDARFESRSGVELGENGAHEALLWFDVSAWFETVPISECLEDGDLSIARGTLLIDDEASSGCSDIENELKRAIKNSGDLR
jgi:hypothetical protein